MIPNNRPQELAELLLELVDDPAAAISPGPGG
jgi:hypothetical protein